MIGIQGNYEVGRCLAGRVAWVEIYIYIYFNTQNYTR